MNYYDFSLVDFVLDKTVKMEEAYTRTPVGELTSTRITKQRVENPILVIDVQINGGRFTLKDWKAEKFVKDFNDYLALKEEG